MRTGAARKGLLLSGIFVMALAMALCAGCDNASNPATTRHTITFDSHEGSAVAAITANEGTEVPQPEDPARPGYSFDGWFAAETGGTAIVWPYTPTANITLHARWTALPQYTITFNGNGAGATEVAAITDYAGTAVDQPADPTRTGYYFAGWFDRAIGGTEYTWPHTLTGNVAMYARWSTVPRYIITFDSHEGSQVENISAFRDTAVDQPADPAREYYTFAGWFDAAEGGTAIVWPYTPTANITLHARWTAISCVIAFDSHGGSPVGSITENAGTTVNKPDDPTWTGYRFTGWFVAETGGTAIVWPYIPTASITLHAQWQAAYTITFDTQESAAAVEPLLVDAGTEAVKPVDPHVVTKSFLGWFASTTGGTAIVWPYTPTANITLYAQWQTGIATHTITFESHGGSTVAAITDNENWQVPQPAAPTRTDYDFTGWFNAASGGTAYEWPHTLTANVTMHAQWTLKTSTVSAGAISITIKELTDPAGSALDDESFVLAKPDGTKTITINGSVDNVVWYVGLGKVETGNSVTLNAANLTTGTHTLGVTAKYAGKTYSKEITFTVTE
jgi:uncharacterized repeat protein (TIGR02543 family)